MNIQVYLTLTSVFFICVTFAVPPNERVYDRDVSGSDHNHDGQHNMQYDHEAFLGKEQAAEFDKLTPEESKRRLLLIVKKVDANNDGRISADELKAWITHISQKVVRDQVIVRWSVFKIVDDKLTWTNYVDKMYGNMEDHKGTPENYNKMTKSQITDKKKWSVADENKDGQLDTHEFLAFLFPEEVPRMREIVVDNALAELDANNDGSIDLSEFASDMKRMGRTDDQLELDRSHFSTFHDKDQDGKLNREEIAEWSVPKDYDHVASETEHLMFHADKNKDGYLDPEEVLKEHNLFAGSQVSDYGEAIKQPVRYEL